jgi:hypothetical protein
MSVMAYGREIWVENKSHKNKLTVEMDYQDIVPRNQSQKEFAMRN